MDGMLGRSIILVPYKQNIISMSRQQIVYALSSQGYFETSRPTSHPSIISANEKNVHLNYLRCHEVHKGESHFKDPQAEEFYRQSRSLPAKGHMLKSQITSASTSFHEEPDRSIHDLTANVKSRRLETRLVAKSYHFGNQVYRVENTPDQAPPSSKNVYEYEETETLRIPTSLDSFQRFKSGNTLIKSLFKDGNSREGDTKEVKTIRTLMQGAKLDSSFHLDDSPAPDKEQQSNTLNSPKTPGHENTLLPPSGRLIPKDVSNSPKSKKYLQINSENKLKSFAHSEGLPEDPGSAPTSLQQIGSFREVTSDPETSTYTLRLNKVVENMYIIKEECNESPVLSSTDQLNRLRLQLAKKEREVRQLKQNLEWSEKKAKMLEIENKKLQAHNSTAGTSYGLHVQTGYKASKMCSEACKQLGGQVPALLYFTLFMVLLAKDVVNV